MSLRISARKRDSEESAIFAGHSRTWPTNEVRTATAFGITELPTCFFGRIAGVCGWNLLFQEIDSPVVPLDAITRFEIESVEKGELKASDEISLKGGSVECLCIKGFELGKRYRVLASRKKLDGATSLVTKYCDFIVEVDDASGETGKQALKEEALGAEASSPDPD